MNEERLRRALRSASPPDELEVERRSWRLVRAAYAEDRDRSGAPHRWPTRALVVLAVLVALVAAVVSPPGEAVTTWLREAIGIQVRDGKRSESRRSLVSLPGRGRLLVRSRQGLWVVHGDGSRRRLGEYDGAAWSPRGLFVAATRGRRLVAIEPDDADVRWVLSRTRRVRYPAWAPSGYRIAYGVGSAVHVVAGDGSLDRLLARRVLPGAWGWRPQPGRNVLAYVTRTGVLQVVDVDTRKRLWRWDQGEERAEEVAWSADGSRLVARAPHALYVFDASGRLLASVPPAPSEATRSLDVAFAPRGHAFAVTSRNAAGRSRAVLLRAERRARSRLVFAGDGLLRRVAWSPDGRWLLVTWPTADQWLFLRVPEVRRVVAVSNIGREFDPGGRGRSRFPRLIGWCCAS
jgi:sugar lactone lactonase YvrE